MNKKQFINNFIIKYQKFISSDKDKTPQIKEGKKNFIEKYGKKYGILKNNEIAKNYILYLIEIQKVKDISDIEKQIKNSFFLRKNITNVSIFEIHLKMPKDCLEINTEDIKKLQSEKYIIKKTQDYVNKAKIKAEKEVKIIKEKAKTEIIKEKIELEKEKEKFAEIKSQLDDLKIDDVEFEKETAILLDSYSENLEKETSDIWWKKLNLIQNPFPTKTGLKRVVQDKFKESNESPTEKEKNDFLNQIIVKTPIFLEFEKEIDSSPEDILDKNYLILGEFGSGKSVFSESLSGPLIFNQILPIYIWLDSSKDVEDISYQFYKEILNSNDLNSKYLELFNYKINKLELEYNKLSLAQIIKEIIKKGGYRGIVIFVDGLHKEEEFYASSLRFVRNLQNLTDFLIDQDIHVSHFITGSKIWEKELLQNSSLSGSFYQIKNMPEINDFHALTMFNRRFFNLSADLDRPTQIKKDFINRIYKRIKGRSTKNATFRDFIDVILPSLQEGNLESVHINPLYDKQTMEKIFYNLKESHSGLYQGFIELKNYFTKKPQNAIKLVNLLVGVFNTKLIIEDSSLFKEKKHFFKLLSHLNLIQKRIIKNNEVAWKIDSKIERFNSEIQKLSSFNFSDVILDLFKSYILEEKTKSEEKETNMETNLLESILISNPKWKKELELRIKDTIKKHQELISLKGHIGLNKINKDEIIQKVENSLKPLIETIFISSKLNITNENFDQLNKRLMESWIFEKIQEYALFHNKRYYLKTQTNAEKLDKDYIEFISLYYRIYPKLVILLEEFIKLENILPLGSNFLTIEDVKIFHLLRSKYYENDYSGLLKLLNSYYEDKMRENLYNLFKIKYGAKWKSRLGTIVNDYINGIKIKNKNSYLSFKENPNILNYADRKHYSLIILDKIKIKTGELNNSSQNWNQIFNFIYSGISKEQLGFYFSSIEPFLIGSSHNYSSKVWADNSHKLSFALRNLIEVIEGINKIYYLILEKNNIYIEEGEEDSKMIYFSFMPKFNDKSHLLPYKLVKGEICKKIGEKIEDKFNENKEIIINFEDEETIMYKFKCQYNDFIATLAVLIKNEKIDLIFEKCEYCIRKGKLWSI